MGPHLQQNGLERGKQLVTILPLPPGYRPQDQGLPPPQPTKSGAMGVLATMPGVPITAPQERQQVLEKVFLKAAYNGSGKKDVKTFTLRKVDPAAITSSKNLNKACLSGDITSGNFDVGYMQGGDVIRVRTAEDLQEMWTDMNKVKGGKTLWCDGLVDGKISSKSGSKRKQQTLCEDESEDKPPRPKKTRKRKVDNEDKVQEIVDSLRSKYGSKFTILQLHIWAELISSGLYSSTDDPPSMFQRAGGGSSIKKPDHSESQPLNNKTALSGHGSSPAKVIDNGSKLYKQLTELQNLKSLGVLDDCEYVNEKETIMELLKQLKGQ